MTDSSISQSAETTRRLTALQQSPVTAALFGVNLALFLLLVFCTSARSILVPSPQVLLDWGANFGPLSLGGEPWRIGSNSFIHASIFHLAVNLYVLFDLGRATESMFGSRKMFAIYMISGLAGSLASLVWNPYVVSAGASGALFGLLGAYVANAAVTGGIKQLARPQKLILFGTVALSCVYGAVLPGVDNAAHLGGFAAGAALAIFLVGREKCPVWQRRDTAVVLSALFLVGYGIFFQARKENAKPAFKGHLAYQNAVVLLREGKYKEAMTDLDKAVKLVMTDASIYCDRARALNALGRHEEALADCERAIALDAKKASSYMVRALTYHALGKDELAVADLTKTIDLDPNNGMAYNNR
ncbi:MAG TPA: rhomboid family intramembrane serine protease, partial [Candidatus Obscuribacterales bacterium]